MAEGTTIRRRRTDILVLGAGGAGLLAALHAKDAAPDLDVTIAVKGLLGKCGCTRMVQGGYNGGGGFGGQGQSGYNAPAGGAADDPWATGGSTSFGDEPPF